jgi:hypothetical protein
MAQYSRLASEGGAYILENLPLERKKISFEGKNMKKGKRKKGKM